MSDFTNGLWGSFVAVVTVIGIVACVVLLKAQSVKRPAGAKKPELHGHVWDGDLAEYNNPLPRWWMWLFYVTVVFGLIYLMLYPGLGSYAGAFNWTSRNEHETETKLADTRYGPIFNKFAQQDLALVAKDAEARAIGQRLFLTYCAQCHGSDAGGGPGFPNLRDKDWLYGGEPEAIKASILDGRNGQMPPLGQALGGEAGVKEMANYVLSLSGAPHDASLAVKAKDKFAMCAACHGPEGKGNPQIGAPNLSDRIWLHGGTEKKVIETITAGRASQMPAHKELLGEAKSHLLAAYVYGLSLEPGVDPAQKAYSHKADGKTAGKN